MTDKGERNEPPATGGLERELEMAQSQLVSYARDFKQTINQLRASEERLSTALETARDAIVIVDAERGAGTITAWNRAAEALFGYSKDEAIGRGVHEFLVPPRLRAAAQAGMAHFATTGEGAAINQTLELPARHKDGTEFPIELSLAAMQIRGQWHAIGILRDIRERKAHEAQINNLNRALRTLSACNLALVHAQSEEELFQNVCRHIVEIGGHRLAWIGFVEHDNAKSIRPAAYHGFEEGYLETLALTWADTERGQGPTSRAIRSGKPALAPDIHGDPAFAPWRAEAEARGYASSISLPLLEAGEVFGALNIYSAAANAYDDDEIKLMEELAADLAYGIVTLRTRAERDRALAGELRSAAELRQVLEQAIAAIALTLEKRDPYAAGHQQRVARLAAAIASEMGLPPQQVQGVHLGALLHNIGTVAVPAEILNRPGKLSDLQFSLVKSHTQMGFEIVKDIPFPWPVAQMVLQHHERLDGSGYPQGLKGEQIILEARILAVADVLEAMLAYRPYRAALGRDAALDTLRQGRGSQFDPAVVDACLRVIQQPGDATSQPKE